MHIERYPLPARMLGPFIATLVVVAICAAPAAATPLKCRRATAKAAALFVQSAMKSAQRCEDAILRGQFAGPCPDQKGTAKLAKLRSKLAAAVAVACGGTDKRCGTGIDDEPMSAVGWTGGSCPDIAATGCTNALADCSDTSECLRCVDETATDATIVLAYRDLHLDAGDPAIRKCQRAIGKESAQFVATQVRALQQCEDRVLRGKVAGPCPDAVASARLAKSQSKMQGKICKACGGPSRACGGGDDLTPAQIGFAATCPDVVIPGGAACGGPLTTLAEIVTCVDCVGRHRAVCLDRLAAPGITTYPDECNDLGTPATPTATATVTPAAPTATATQAATVTPTATTTPTPTATATDTPTPTATATPSSVTVRLDLSTGLVASLVNLNVAYPTQKGGFAGTGSGVACNTGALGVFTANDDDAGTLDLDLSLGLGLTFPLSIDCTFDLLAGETLSPSDLVVGVDQFLFGIVPLDPSQLGIVTSILP